MKRAVAVIMVTLLVAASGCSGSSSGTPGVTPPPGNPVNPGGGGPADLTTSINSTSANSARLPAATVAVEAFVPGVQFQTLASNDLGMHCGDLDHRIASILPPFNVVHAQVVQKGAVPLVLTGTQADVFYSAASNPLDPALQVLPGTSVFKTNFWDLNPRGTGRTLGFDAYDPFYPPGILSLFPLGQDTGLPVPDMERLYLGDGQLVADQQPMPGAASPYAANDPQRFLRFNTNLPFFINFPFGYTLNSVRWFAAEGVPIAPFDDQGRKNSFPLMRITSRAAQGNTLGLPASTGLASVDVVLPVSAEADCYRCHTSSADGGNGQAACIPGVDPGCTAQGSLRSGTPFTVATAASDDPSNPPKCDVNGQQTSISSDSMTPRAARTSQNSTPVALPKVPLLACARSRSPGTSWSGRRRRQWKRAEDPPDQFAGTA